MTKEFVTYEQALALKELGFDEPCLTYYHENQRLESEIVFIKGSKFWNLPDISEIAAPTFSQAFRWFREKYGLIGQPIPLCISYPGKVTHYGWSIVSNQNSIDWENEDNGFKIYEEAESACLDKLIELIKNK